MPKSDEDLMLEFRQGATEEVFAQLVERHQRGLLNFFYQFCWDRGLAEDLCQEVFCRVFAHRHSYSVTAKFSTYLYRIARNLWIDYTRAHRNRPRVVSLDAETEEGARVDQLELEPRVRQHDLTAGEGLEQQELVARVQQALDQLPDEQRAVFVLARNQGLKYSEVAEVLDIPVGTVRSRMHAAMRRLQALLKHLEHKGK